MNDVYDLYKNLLHNQNIELYNRFFLVCKLMRDITDEYLILSKDYSLLILKSYIKGKRYIPLEDFLIDRIYLFCESFIDIMDANKEELFEKTINEHIQLTEIKNKIKNSKARLLKIYLGNYIQQNKEENKNKIYNNKFFKWMHLKNPYESFSNHAYFHNSGIVFRIYLKGKIHYENHFTCCENEILFCNTNFTLGNYHVCTPNVEFIIFHISSDFFKKFSFEIPSEEYLKKSFFLDKEDKDKLIDLKFDGNENLILTELFIVLLKYITDDLSLESYNEEMILKNEILSVIEDNIFQCEKNISERLLDKLKLPEKSIEKICYNFYKKTLKKLIIDLKIEKIAEFILNNEYDINNIIETYNLKNYESLNYNFKKKYNISIKDFKNKLYK